MTLPSDRPKRYFIVPSIFETSFSSTVGIFTTAFSFSVSRSFFEMFVIPSKSSPRCIHPKICFARYFGSPREDRNSATSSGVMLRRSTFSVLSVILSS